MVVPDGVGGGELLDEAIARSLVRETPEMRSLLNVFVERRQHLSEEQGNVSTVLRLLGSSDVIFFFFNYQLQAF